MIGRAVVPSRDAAARAAPVLLAILSLAFHRTCRTLTTLLMRVHALVERGRKPQWRIFSAALLAERWMLPIIMSQGPRWNTHAVQANLAPVLVHGTLSVRVRSARESALAWTITINEFPGFRSVAEINSIPSPPEEWRAVPLSPGVYSLSLRYYEPFVDCRLPAVHCDGQKLAEEAPVPPETTSIWRNLAARDGLLYRWLNYYVLGMLAWRHILPAGLVEREFLPIGNPATRFRFGLLEIGDVLVLQVDPGVSTTELIYVTTYNASSFPLHSYRVDVPELRLDPAAVRGYFLVRIHPFRAREIPWTDDLLRLTVRDRDGVERLFPER